MLLDNGMHSMMLVKQKYCPCKNEKIEKVMVDIYDSLPANFVVIFITHYLHIVVIVYTRNRLILFIAIHSFDI